MFWSVLNQFPIETWEFLLFKKNVYVCLLSKNDEMWKTAQGMHGNCQVEVGSFNIL